MIGGDRCRRLRRSWRRGRRGRRRRRRCRRRRRPACPAIAAEAAFVPWAEDGMRQTSRSSVAAAAVPGPDGEQAGELALAAGVRLQRDGVVAGDLAQPALEVGDEARGSPRPGRAGRRDGGRPHSGHVIGSISVVPLSFIVHEPSGIIVRSSARSWSARRRSSRSIAVSEWSVREGGVLEERRRPRQGGRQAVGGVGAVGGRRAAEGGEHGGEVGRGRRLVAGDADVVGVDEAEAAPRRRRRRRRPRRPGPARGPSTVSKKASWTTSTPPAAQAVGEQRRRGGGCGGRCGRGRRGRATGRRGRPSRRAAPGRCRCSTSPSPGGCAARGSGGRGGWRGRRRRRRTRRRGGPGSDRSSPARTAR